MKKEIHKLQNKFGESIEIRPSKNLGCIQIRHSDVDSKKWGSYHEYAGTAFMTLDDELYLLDQQEISAIRDVVLKQFPEACHIQVLVNKKAQ
jgi:hypothetical protein